MAQGNRQYQTAQGISARLAHESANSPIAVVAVGGKENRAQMRKKAY